MQKILFASWLVVVLVALATGQPTPRPSTFLVPPNACQIHQDCGTCVSDPACFWCASGNICTPDVPQQRQACNRPLDTCGCGTYTSCSSCTPQLGCVWCNTFNSCNYYLDVGFCPDTRNFPTQCPPTNPPPPPQQSDDFCLRIPSCSNCASSGCTWCRSQGLCRSFNAGQLTCPASQLITFPSFC